MYRQYKYLVIEAVGDGVGLNAIVLHLEQQLDGQYWLMVDAAQLQQHAVAHLQAQPPPRHQCNAWHDETHSTTQLLHHKWTVWECVGH